MQGMSAFIYAIAGIAVGGVITFLVSRYYYRRASEELHAEAERLRQESESLHDMTMRMLQTASGGGHVEVNRDEEGRPTGVHHRITITDQIGIEDQVEAQLNPPEEEDR